MKQIYIAGKITGECETPELMEKCKMKFYDYGVKQLYPPDGDITPYTMTKLNFFIRNFDSKIEFTNGFLINKDILGKASWQTYMKNSIAVMVTCDEVHFLKDWKESKGAKIEHQLALDLDIKVVYELIS